MRFDSTPRQKGPDRLLILAATGRIVSKKRLVVAQLATVADPEPD